MGKPEGTATEAPLGAVELAPAPRLRSATPSYVQLARVEGYGNPQTGELWMRAVPLVEGFQGFEVGGPRDQPASSGVGVSAQALGRVPGYCEATYEADGVPNNNPNGTLEFYNQYDATGNAADQSSFTAATCYSKLDAQFQTAIHSALFASQGVGCAYQHVGNFTGINYNRLLLDVDVFNGSLATHGPYGPPFTTGTVVTPEGRNAPYQDLGLWDFGPMPSGSAGQTTGPHLKNMWVYFKNGDSNDFNWTGYILGEVFEECGDDDDDDCDGVDDNGCGELVASEACFSDTDCASGHCDGASIVSGQGEGGGELGDDVAGSCSAPHVQVSAGTDATCRIASNGIQCWGDAADPLQSGVPSGTDHAELSVGTWHACTLRADGQITCWGDNTDGRADSQSATDHVEVSAGGFHNCAVHSDSTVSCWGNNTVGQAPEFAGGDFVSVTAGYDFSCGLKHNGSIECWGDDTYAQTTPPVNDVFRSVSAGTWHACAIAADGDLTCWGDPAFSKLNAPTGSFTDVAPGLHHTCALRSDGSLACWGYSSYGQTTPPTGTDYVSVTSGRDHSCAVKTDDSIVCWGRNHLGQATVPVIPEVPNPETHTLSSGWVHGCAIMPDTGKVKCWGNNTGGYLGLGLSDRSVQTLGNESPDRNLGSSPAVQISTGNAHTCVLADDQTVRCFGSNNSWESKGSSGGSVMAGRLDATPAALNVGGPAMKVLASNSFTCVLREDAKLVCWGVNDAGQIGTGTATTPIALSSSTPVALDQPVADFCVGGSHMCALLQNGSLRCWGDNGQGQLGLGHTNRIGDNEAVTSVAPVLALTTGEVAAGRTIAQVACGVTQTCVVLDDGNMRCWGEGSFGALGYGNTNDIGDNEHPNTVGYVNIGAGETVDQVMSGDDVTCTLSNTDVVKCWGWVGRVTGAHTASCLGHTLGSCSGNVTSPPSTGIDFGGDVPAELGFRSRAATVCARMQNDGVRCWHVNGTSASAVGIGNTSQDAVAIPNGAYTIAPSHRVADMVLGQVETAGGSYTAPSNASTGMNAPSGVAVDPATGKVFVADASNHRVLRYGSYDALMAGASAERVFGQADFGLSASNRGGSMAANTLSVPFDVLVDGAGNLWVSDSANARVLRFANAASQAVNGPNADGVLGANGFTAVVGGTSANGFASPTGLAMHSDGTLWVADYGNNRVLRIDNAATVADADGGAVASAVLGQATFVTNTQACSVSSMALPRQLAIDGNRLWVADHANNRVLRFENAGSLANGGSANTALGQPDLVTCSGGLTSSTLSAPSAVAVDASGNVYVADTSNNRIVTYDWEDSLVNGPAAIWVIGAKDLSTSGTGSSGDKLNQPWDLTFDPAGALWVVERGNNRTTSFLP